MTPRLPRVLLVIRHAKSSWESGAVTDHARPLNGRGRRDAPRVGIELAARGWRPDRVLCSDAVRARQTWQGIQDGWDNPPKVTFERRLYHSGTAAVRDLCAGLPLELGCLAVVGHNPGWEELIEDLSGLEVRVTTGNVVRLEGAGRSWPDALARPWRVAAVVRPRDLEETLDLEDTPGG